MPQKIYTPFLRLIFSLILLSFLALFWSSVTQAFSDDETLITLYDHQKKSLRSTSVVLPPHFEKITNTLPQAHWPMLPESYRWVIDDAGEVELFKHISANPHEFDFVIYGPDHTNRVNFLSRWDCVTHHSFAHTRSPSLHNDQARSNFPINASGFKWNGQTFERGHLIDFCDTMGLTNQQKVALKEVNPKISTLDPRNYTPEPPRTHWGRSLRKELVGAIRAQRGNYSQYLYYPEIPKTTAYGTLIPEGCYFTEMSALYEIQNTYHVPWDHPIHDETAKGTHWRTRLAPLLTQDGFLPSPFIDDQRKTLSERDFFELPIDYEIPASPLSYKDSFLLTRAADTELSFVTGKTNITLYLLQAHQNDEKTTQWLCRLLDHAQFLDDLGALNFLPEHPTKKLLTTLKKQETLVDPDNRYQDHLAQIYQNQEEEGLGLKQLFKLEEDFPLTLPPLRDHPQVNPPTLMDMSAYEKLNKDFYATVRSALENHHPLHFLNLSTPRAKTIAEFIRSLMDTQTISEDVSINYSPSSSQKWNIQPAFDKKNITARRLDF